MNPAKTLGIALLALGIAALAYGGFTYTKHTDKVSIGPLDLTVKDKETVNVPMWAGIAAVIVGGVLLVAPRKT